MQTSSSTTTGHVCAFRYKFTGKERDSESGLDYFGARYFASNMGRMMSPDDFVNDTHASGPQSWNLYAYARNNPLRYIDPTGQIVENTDDLKHKLTQGEMKDLNIGREPNYRRFLHLAEYVRKERREPIKHLLSRV